VAHAGLRLRESAKLGFAHAFGPEDKSLSGKSGAVKEAGASYKRTTPAKSR
jgi:DNA repair protein RadA/Sms